MKRLLFLLVVLSPSAFAEGANANMVYYDTLINIFFNVVLTISFLLAFIALGWISGTGIRYVLNPNLAQQDGKKPMTIAKYMGGLAVVSILAFPLSSMKIFNDLSGLGGGEGMCLVVDVNVSHLNWTNSASACIEKVEDKLAELAEYTNREHIESANLGILFGVLQLIGLSMFVGSGWMLIMHIVGLREVKMTVAQSLLSMFVATVVMTLPNVADYIKDFKGQQNVVLDT